MCGIKCFRKTLETLCKNCPLACISPLTYPSLASLLSSDLFLILQWTCAAVEITERRGVAEGSSVLLCAPDTKNANIIEWEHIKNTSSEFILQYYADSQSPTIYPAYQGRVIFYPENGSLLLLKLREMDNGVYKATVDLVQDKARTTLLEVIKPVPQPELQYSSSLAGSPIELVCVLPKGRVDVISWKKEGHLLPLERCYQLSENNTVLRIAKGEKADCGSYSCNVSNEISWKEAVLNLTVVGLPRPLRYAQIMAAAALMFAAGSVVDFIVLLCQPDKQGFGKKVRRWMTLCIQGLVCVSSLLLLTTSIFWVQQEGYCVILNTAAPTAVIVLVLFTSLLLQNIQRLHERGCSEPINLMLIFILTAAVALFMPLVFFLCYHKSVKKERKMENVQVVRVTGGMATLVQEEL
ncbi:uncharacterized protein LOC134145138 isoform X3 [Rhea pennata]|uniref:uncharacterized protein LOC134145138 isoform X3 n=1 Tax=Rhea pennata TaxID=8795 RepID=UPI002E25972E